MKAIIVLAIVCAAIGLSDAKLTADDIAKLKTIATDCKAKESATDDDINSMIALELPKTPTGKCLHACMQEAIGIIKDGKVNVDAVVAIASKMFKDNESMIKVTREVTEICAPITDPDRCEMAVKAMKCSHDEINKRGIKFADYMV